MSKHYFCFETVITLGEGVSIQGGVPMHDTGFSYNLHS